MKDVISVDSNSKSEDTPIPEQFEYGLENPLELLDNPPQDSPLGQVTSLDTVCDELVHKHELPLISDWCCLREDSVREAISLWHKAERAKLFEQIRSEAKSYTIEVMQSDGYEVTERAVPLEALTRLEKNEKVTE